MASKKRKVCDSCGECLDDCCCEQNLDRRFKEIERLLKIIIRNQKRGYRYPNSYLEGYSPEDKH